MSIMFDIFIYIHLSTYVLILETDARFNKLLLYLIRNIV